MFKGSLVALITPMRADGAVDEDAFKRLVDWQITEGTSGLIPVGTTGESPTLSHDEHRRVVEMAIEVAKGRAPVIARGRIEQHGGGDRADPSCQAGGGGRGAGRDALLQ